MPSTSDLLRHRRFMLWAVAVLFVLNFAMFLRLHAAADRYADRTPAGMTETPCVDNPAGDAVDVVIQGLVSPVERHRFRHKFRRKIRHVRPHVEVNVRSLDEGLEQLEASIDELRHELEHELKMDLSGLEVDLSDLGSHLSVGEHDGDFDFDFDFDFDEHRGHNGWTHDGSVHVGHFRLGQEGCEDDA